MTKDGATYYLGYDQVGTLKVVADASGNVIRSIEYDAFGNILSDSDPAFAVPFGFAGGLHDRDTGLVRFGYRDYDPETGRWTAKDPILFAGGDTDLYGYCVNDPVNWADPDGLVRGRRRGPPSGNRYVDGHVKRLIRDIKRIEPDFEYGTFKRPSSSMYDREDVGYLENYLRELRLNRPCPPPRERSRDRIRKIEDALNQLEGIEKAQEHNREAIESIRKSQDMLRNLLRKIE